MKNIELLAPAGNIKKMKVAFHFGADAVYVGGKTFSLRAFADNFSNDELDEATKYAHSIGKKIYVTANIFAKNYDLDEAKKYFEFLESINVDGAIISDPGLIMLAKTSAPELPIHISTQANTQNKLSVEFWGKYGAERVVLARELSFNEMKKIHEHNPTVELEAFVHGAMCISYSGRCWLSNYLVGRDANRGECVQSCRWNYSLIEESRKDKVFNIEEDDRGAYILNSKDLNLLSDIPSLIDSGIMSFKVEGRVKSEFYIAGVINAYRHAIDEYLENGEFKNLDVWENELCKISHREYTKAFTQGDNDNTINAESKVLEGTTEFVAIVKGYDEKTKIATVEMRNRFKTGEELEILSPTDSFNKKFAVPVMKDQKGNDVDDALLVQQILDIKMPYPVLEGDIFRRNK